MVFKVSPPMSIGVYHTSGDKPSIKHQQHQEEQYHDMEDSSIVSRSPSGDGKEDEMEGSNIRGEEKGRWRGERERGWFH